LFATDCVVNIFVCQALKAKAENPEVMITYVRKSNRRGDRRHPHH
jgi:hypothetical protein